MNLNADLVSEVFERESQATDKQLLQTQVESCLSPRTFRPPDCAMPALDQIVRSAQSAQDQIHQNLFVVHSAILAIRVTCLQFPCANKPKHLLEPCLSSQAKRVLLCRSDSNTVDQYNWRGALRPILVHSESKGGASGGFQVKRLGRGTSVEIFGAGDFENAWSSLIFDAQQGRSHYDHPANPIV